MICQLESSRLVCAHVKIQPDLHKMRFQVAMCNLQPNRAVSLILAAGTFDVVLQGLYVCLTDHGASSSYVQTPRKNSPRQPQSSILYDTPSEHVVGIVADKYAAMLAGN